MTRLEIVNNGRQLGMYLGKYLGMVTVPIRLTEDKTQFAQILTHFC